LLLPRIVLGTVEDKNTNQDQRLQYINSIRYFLLIKYSVVQEAYTHIIVDDTECDA
jgi:hypothetical protein